MKNVLFFLILGAFSCAPKGTSSVPKEYVVNEKEIVLCQGLDDVPFARVNFTGSRVFGLASWKDTKQEMYFHMITPNWCQDGKVRINRNLPKSDSFVNFDIYHSAQKDNVQSGIDSSLLGVFLDSFDTQKRIEVIEVDKFRKLIWNIRGRDFMVFEKYGRAKRIGVDGKLGRLMSKPYRRILAVTVVNGTFVYFDFEDSYEDDFTTVRDENYYNKSQIYYLFDLNEKNKVENVKENFHQYAFSILKSVSISTFE